MSEFKEKKSSEQQLVETIRRVPLEFNKIDPMRLAEEVSKARCANINFCDKIEREKFGPLVKAIITSIDAETNDLLCNKKFIEIGTKIIWEPEEPNPISEENLQKAYDELNTLKAKSISKIRNVIEDAKNAINVLGDDKTTFSKSLLFHSLLMQRTAYMALSESYEEDFKTSAATLTVGNFLGVKSNLVPPSVLEATIEVAEENGRKSKNNAKYITEKLKDFDGTEKEASSVWILKFAASLDAQLSPKFMAEMGFNEKEIRPVSALLNLEVKEAGMTPKDKLKMVNDGVELVEPELVLEWGLHGFQDALKDKISIFVIESEVNVMRALSEGKAAADAIAMIVPELKEFNKNFEGVIVNNVANFHARGDELQKWWNENQAKEAKTFSKRS